MPGGLFAATSRLIPACRLNDASGMPTKITPSYSLVPARRSLPTARLGKSWTRKQKMETKVAYIPSQDTDTTARSLGLDQAIERAVGFLLSCQTPEGYWAGELEGDTILESEYIILMRFLGRGKAAKLDKAARFILTKQMENGGWAIFPGGPVDVSASVKAYLALKLTIATGAEPYMARSARGDQGGRGSLRRQQLHPVLPRDVRANPVERGPGGPARSNASPKLGLLQHIRDILVVPDVRRAAEHHLVAQAHRSSHRSAGNQGADRAGRSQETAPAHQLAAAKLAKLLYRRG